VTNAPLIPMYPYSVMVSGRSPRAHMLLPMPLPMLMLMLMPLRLAPCSAPCGLQVAAGAGVLAGAPW
jgi:hypothetical protein